MSAERIAEIEISSGVTFGAISEYVRSAVGDALPGYGQQDWRREDQTALVDRITTRIMAGIAPPIFEASVRMGTETGKRLLADEDWLASNGLHRAAASP